MDTNTGRIYTPEEMGPAMERAYEQSRRALLEQDLAEREHLAALVEDRQVVPVSDKVARTMALGNREQRRRQQRRKKARRS